MKVLVTGGNGFIGRHIVQELRERGIEVVSFDLFKPKLHLPGVTYITGTILDEFTLTKLMKGCCGVFHLAALLGVRRCEAEVLKCMNINIIGTRTVLRSMQMAGIRKIFFTSSSEIFGDISREKIKETSPFNPKSGYAMSKLAGEQYVMGFHDDFGMEYRIVRFFNIYGPGQVAEFVIPRFIRMARNGNGPVIYGEGNQVRSFCYISDAARASVELFLRDDAANESFNIGNDLEPITVKDLAGKVARLTGSPVKPFHVPFSQSDRKSSREIYYRVPDITKVRERIGYQPEVDLETGLEKVIATGDIPASWVEPLPVVN